MLKAKVSEIFRSLQGEGRYMGLAQVFVRFAGCPTGCRWCDTVSANEWDEKRHQEFSAEELTREVLREARDCREVSLTGGEPLVQTNFLKNFLPLLRRKKFRVHLETSGIFPLALRDVVDLVDVIAMDVKLPSSTGIRGFWRQHDEFLRTALKREVFVKAVISKKTKLSDVIRAARLVARRGKGLLFILQPNAFELDKGLLERCYAFQGACMRYLSDVRVLPQMHKMLRMR